MHSSDLIARQKKDLPGDERGGIAVLFGLIVPLLVLGVGVAVDTGRWIHAKRITSAALDSAVLAGARALQLDPSNHSAALDVARQYYNGNISGRVSLTNSSVDFALTDDNKAITATGAAELQTYFLRISGIDTLPVLGQAGASYPKASIRTGGRGGGHLEVAVALDVTGSMCDDGQGPCSSSVKIHVARSR